MKVSRSWQHCRSGIFILNTFQIMVLMQPEFLISFDAFPENVIEENRRWVFHLPTESLIEFFPVKQFSGINNTKFPIEKHYYSGENEYKAIMMKGTLTGQEADELLDKCWIAYLNRLI
jgi:hypothetical protein